MRVLTVAVLISGTGSNLRALLEAAADPAFPARVIVVGADREAAGPAHAEALGIPRKTLHDKLRKHGLHFEGGSSGNDDHEDNRP